MDLPTLKYWPMDYAQMIKAAFRFPLFHDSVRNVFHIIPDWLTTIRIIVSQMKDDHLDDLRLLMQMLYRLPPFDGDCSRLKEIQLLQAELAWSEHLFPWFAGILKAKNYIGIIASTLLCTDRVSLIRACLTALVLMDDQGAAEKCLEVFQSRKSKLGNEYEAEFAMGFWLMDQRMGTSYLVKANLKSSHRGSKVRNAVVIGDMVRGGIPVESRRRFQQELAKLIALSTPWEAYPRSVGDLFPKKLMHHWNEIADLRSELEGIYEMHKQKVRQLYRLEGRESVSRYLERGKFKPILEPLIFSKAVQQFAGRGWDQHSIGELLANLQPRHSPHDLETALELDIYLRLPIGVVEAIFENLIAQFPLFFELYHRYAVQLLLRSKTCDAKAAALYEKGEALRTLWKMQWFVGFQIPMMALTIPAADNHPNALMSYR